MQLDKILVLITFFTFCFKISGICQQTSIKLYTNFYAFNSDQSPRETDYEKSNLSYIGMTYGYNFSKNNTTFHQFETRLHFSNPSIGNDKLKITSLHLRYERATLLNKGENNKLKVKVAPAIKTYYLNETKNNNQNSSIPFTSRNIIGINSSVFGIVEYELTQLFSFELGISVFSLDFHYEKYISDNPSLTLNQRTFTSGDGGFLGDSMIRIGIGYKIK